MASIEILNKEPVTATVVECAECVEIDDCEIYRLDDPKCKSELHIDGVFTTQVVDNIMYNVFREYTCFKSDTVFPKGTVILAGTIYEAYTNSKTLNKYSRVYNCINETRTIKINKNYFVTTYEVKTLPGYKGSKEFDYTFEPGEYSIDDSYTEYYHDITIYSGVPTDVDITLRGNLQLKSAIMIPISTEKK